MKSPYKNATKAVIKGKILKLRDEQFPFHQPILQHDTFWIYCNARRYWGAYRKALDESNIKLKNNEIKSEVGYKIDCQHQRQ